MSKIFDLLNDSLSQAIEYERGNIKLPAKKVFITRAKNNMKWISVKDRLPKNGQLVFFIEKSTNIAFSGMFLKRDDINPERWKKNSYCDERENILYEREITHWMPLPNTPKE